MKTIKFVVIFSFMLAIKVSSLYSQAWAHYDTTDGMFTNSAIFSVADRYDNIWIAIGSGSFGDGLEKFDGNNWTHFEASNSGLPENDVMVVAPDTNGVLWMCYYGGGGPVTGGLTRYDGVNWTTYDTTNSDILSNWMGDIKVDKENNIWQSHLAGISKFDGVNFTNYPYTECGRFAIDDSNKIWMATQTGLHHFDPSTGIWTNYNTSNSNIPSNSASCIGVDQSGLIWLGFSFGFDGGIGVGGTNGGLATFDGDTFTTIWPLQNAYTGVYDLAIDHTNNVWVATRCEGLYKYDGDFWTNITGVPTDGCSYSVMVDNENFVWFSEYYTGIWTNNMSVGINEWNNLSPIKIYPNPGSDYFMVDFDFHDQDNFIIHNYLGECVATDISNFQETLKVNTEEFTSGIYYWSIVRNNLTIKSGKVAIVHD